MKILVVEDEREIGFLLKYNLELDGHEVTVANNGQEALNHLSPAPELILMDIMMPVMDGIETVTHIKSDPAFKKVPIFMLTAKSQLSDIETAFRAGADDYLTKPFDPDTLNERITLKYQKFLKNLEQ